MYLLPCWYNKAVRSSAPIGEVPLPQFQLALWWVTEVVVESLLEFDFLVLSVQNLECYHWHEQ